MRYKVLRPVDAGAPKWLFAWSPQRAKFATACIYGWSFEGDAKHSFGNAVERCLAVITRLLPKSWNISTRAAFDAPQNTWTRPSPVPGSGHGHAAPQIRFWRAANQVLLPVFSAANAAAAKQQRVSTFTLNGITTRVNFLHLLVWTQGYSQILQHRPELMRLLWSSLNKTQRASISIINNNTQCSFSKLNVLFL